MNNGIIITVNLPGRIGGSVSHTSTQTVRADVSNPKAKNPRWENKEIFHTDREEQEAYMITRISPEVVDHWTGNTPPARVKNSQWRKYSRLKKIAAYVADFDQGFGVTFEEV